MPRSTAKPRVPTQEEKNQPIKLCPEEREELAAHLDFLYPKSATVEDEEEQEAPAPQAPGPQPAPTPAPQPAKSEPKRPLTPDEEARVRALMLLHKLETESAALRGMIDSGKREVSAWKHFRFLQLATLSLARFFVYLYTHTGSTR